MKKFQNSLVTPEDSQGGRLSFVIVKDQGKADELVEHAQNYPVVVTTLQHEGDTISE
jgi:hypothetical protein